MTVADRPASPIDAPGSAIRAMTDRLDPIGTETLPMERVFGRILAQDAITDRPSPAADVSAMDGYVLRMSDLTRGVVPIAGELLIGREPIALTPGTCLRIVTGAPVPAGAEAVIKREDVQERDTSIVIAPERAAAMRSGEHIRRRGDNGPTGTLFAGIGDVVTPALAGALATFGMTDVAVHKPLRVAVISTGDEVLDPGDTPTPWQLRDGNGPTLRALIASRAWATIGMHARVRDDEQVLRHTLAEALSTCDAVLLSGGVSMGHRDFVPGTIRALGGEVVFHKLPQKPGRPMLGAVAGRGKAVFGLPGNPMSVLVTAVRIAMPVLRHLAGGRPAPVYTTVVIPGCDAKPQGIWWYRPVRLVAPGCAELVPSTGSGDVISIAGSNGFVEIPPGQSGPGPWAFHPWSAN